MSLELGFYNGFGDSQTNLIRRLNADLVMINKTKQNMMMAMRASILQAQLYQVSANDGVSEVIPIYEDSLRFKNPDNEMVQSIQIIAFPVESAPFNIEGLEEFAPDTSGMEQLYAYYLKIQRDDQACEVGRHYAGALEREAENNTGKLAARSLYRAFKVYVFLEEPLRSLDCLKRAAQKAPEDYSIHQELAIQFLVHRDFDAAIEQLRWCLRRKPHEARLRQLLAKAQHERIARREAPAPNIKQR